MEKKLAKPDPSEKINFFKGRRVVVEVDSFELPNGYSYARIATKAIGGENGSLFSVFGDDEERSRECGFEGHGLEDLGQIDWDAAEGANPWARGEGRMRRISASNVVYICEKIARSLDAIKERGGMIGWTAKANGAEVDLRSWGASAQLLGHLLDLGSFECSSGTLWGSDPCYDLAEGDGGLIEGAAGTWHAYSTRRGFGEWGDRAAQILIAREGDDPLPWLGEAAAFPWVDAGFECGVDSGQAGFFDIRAYGAPSGDNEAFYDACSDHTLGFMAGGVVEGGAACRSGDGDGGYSVQIARASDGSLLAARILFYEPRPEEIHAWRAAMALAEAADIAAAAALGVHAPAKKI